MHQISSKWHKLKGPTYRKKRFKVNRENAKKRAPKTGANLSTVKNLGATQKKLSLFATNSANCASDEVPTNDSQNFIVHSSLIENLIKSYYCSECEDISPVNFVCGKRNGFAVLMQLVCDNCETVLSEEYSSFRVSEKKNSAFQTNKNIVEAFLKFGSGHSGMLSFCATVHMGAMSLSTYYSHLSTIRNEAEQLRKDNLENSRAAVREVHKILNFSDGASSDIIDILSSFDGTWHKRGFTSLYGEGCVIDVLTGLIVDYVH